MKNIWVATLKSKNEYQLQIQGILYPNDSIHDFIRLLNIIRDNFNNNDMALILFYFRY